MKRGPVPDLQRRRLAMVARQMQRHGLTPDVAPDAVGDLSEEVAAGIADLETARLAQFLELNRESLRPVPPPPERKPPR